MQMKATVAQVLMEVVEAMEVTEAMVIKNQSLMATLNLYVSTTTTIT